MTGKFERKAFSKFAGIIMWYIILYEKNTYTSAII